MTKTQNEKVQSNFIKVLKELSVHFGDNTPDWITIEEGEKYTVTVKDPELMMKYKTTSTGYTLTIYTLSGIRCVGKKEVGDFTLLRSWLNESKKKNSNV